MKMSVYMPRRLPAVLVALLLALAIAACGDSDDGDDGRAGTSQSAGTSADQQAPSDDRTSSDDGDTTGGTGTTDEGGGDDAPSGDDLAGGDRPDGGASEADQVEAVVSGMYKDFASADAAGVCSVLVKSARRQVAQNAAVDPSEKGTCTASLANFLGAAKRSGALEQAAGTKVGKVKVDGDTATAVISLAGRSGKVRLVKEDGEWRFGAVPGAGQTGS